MRISRILFAVVVLIVGSRTALMLARSEAISPWMHQFLLMLIPVMGLSIIAVLTERFRLYLIPFVALLVSIASVPFGDDVGIRLALLTMLGVVTATTKSMIMIRAIMAFHAVWIVAMMDVRTPFPDAPGQSSLETITLLAGWCVIITLVVERGVRHWRQLRSAEQRIHQLDSAVRNLSEANAGYSDFARLARHQALLEERNRITREIHDDIAYTLTNITMMSEAAMSLLTPDHLKASEIVGTIRHQAQTGLYETRRVLRLLRKAEQGLPRGVAALAELVDVYQRATDVHVDFKLFARRARVEDPVVFPTIYHFVQECLTNAFRHGKAANVVVHITEDGDWLSVTVSDDGTAKTKVSEGIGLQGMKERVHALGGELLYFQRDGFVVTARLPLVSQDPVPVSVQA